MKVLTVLPQGGLWGGPLAGFRMARALAARGVKQELCLGTEGPILEEARAAGFPVHRIEAEKKAPSRVVSALLLLYKRKPHLVHAHSLLGLSRDFAVAARILGIPLVWHLHEDLTFPRYKRRLSSVRLLSTLAVAVSKVQLPHLGGTKAIHLPNGVDPQAFPPPSEEDRALARKALGLEGNPFLVLALGRISPDKGSDLLCRALERAREREERIFGLFAGRGKEEDLADLRRVLERGDPPLGRILPPSRQVLPLLHAADLLVLPSLRENCPLVVLEALSTELPVLATPEGDVPRILSGGRGGRFLPPRKGLDRETLASFLVRACRGGGPSREKEGKKGRELILRHYALSDRAARLHHIFRNLAGDTMEEPSR